MGWSGAVLRGGSGRSNPLQGKAVQEKQLSDARLQELGRRLIAAKRRKDAVEVRRLEQIIEQTASGGR